MRPTLVGLWIALSLGLGLGCTPSETPSNNREPEDLTSLKVRSAGQLPEVEYALPALDDGRVEFPVPKGWNTLPRSDSRLIGFFKENQGRLPLILIEAKDVPDATIRTVTRDNVEEFAAWTRSYLKETLGDEKLLEPVRPMILGDQPVARYVRRQRLRLGGGPTVDAEGQVLLIIHNGRLYEISLKVRSKQLREDRDAAYALAAGVKFLSGPSPDNGSETPGMSGENDMPEEEAGTPNEDPGM